MIITKNDPFFKGENVYFRPKKEESHHVQYLLRLAGFSLTKLAIRISVSPPTVFNVIYGRRRSQRVEAEIARILGHDDWNDLVIEARLATSGIFTPTKEQIKKAKQDAINARAERIAKSRQRQFAKFLA